jgi:hypothetical protein
MHGAIDSLLRTLDDSGVEYVLIGGHAVNAWLEPRFTADVDVTVQAGSDEARRLAKALLSRGFRSTREHGADLPSGPDFVRFVSRDGAITLEVQAAKTEFQREVLRRATSRPARPKVATPEDLIVMKLIAHRPKDRLDLLGLIELPDLDWSYVERWAEEWRVRDRLEALRGSRSGAD